MADWNAAARAVWASQQIEALVALGDDRADAAAVVSRLMQAIPLDQNPATWMPDDQTLDRWATVDGQAIHDARVDWLADDAIPVRYKLLLEAGHYQPSLSEGSEESGFHGHAGVPGQVGGSAPGEGGGEAGKARREANRARVAAYRAKKKADTQGLDPKAVAQKHMTIPTIAGKSQPEAAKSLLQNMAAEPGNQALSRVATVKMWTVTHQDLDKAFYAADSAARTVKDYDAVAQLKALEASGTGTVEQVAAIWERSQYPAGSPKDEISYHRIRVDDMLGMTMAARSALKSNICDTIAEQANKDIPMPPLVDPDTGVADVLGLRTKEGQPGALSTYQVNGVIHSWAESSGNHNGISVASQQAAARLFGVDAGFYKEGGELDKGLGIREDSRQLNERVIRAMYENTQKVLSEAGAKTLRVYRGVKVDKAGAPGIDKIKPGDTFTHKSNPMSSWSMSQTTARAFSITGKTAEKGIVLCMDVPVERVVGTCISGFGCYGEQEVVVVGGVEESALVVGV